MQNNLDSNDWQTLRFSPFWVLAGMAGTYRKFDPLEEAAFWHCMDVAAGQAAGLARETLVSVITDRERLVVEFEQDQRPVASGLGAVVSVLATLPNIEAAHFTDVLFAKVATGLARARGPYGNAISREDGETLSILAAFLEVDTDDVNPLNLATPV